MTKLRQNLTQHAAVMKVAAFLGWDTCADIVDMSESQMRKLSDPATGRELKFRDALRLDAAYNQAGGDGFPFFECFAARLGVEAAPPAASQVNVLQASGRAAKETGEALGAALEACASGNAVAKERAIHEAEEGVQAMVSLLQSLKLTAPVD